MSFFQLALKNVTRNKHTYMAHFFSSSFSVMIFFIFAMINAHPTFRVAISSLGGGNKESIVEVMFITQYLVLIFSFFFIFYSTNSFLRKRSKEFGILMVHGMSPSQLNRFIVLENMIIGFGSVTVGILIGVIFSKLSLLLLASLMSLKMSLNFYFPKQAIWFSFLFFFLVFIGISFFTPLFIKKTKPLALIRAQYVPKPEPKASIILSIASIALMSFGYWNVYKHVRDLTLYGEISQIFWGTLSVIVGTYFFFMQFMVYLLKYLKRKDSVYLKSTNLLTFSELTYRMRDHAQTLFISANLLAVVITSLGVTKAYMNETAAKVPSPVAAYLISRDFKNLRIYHNIRDIMKAEKITYHAMATRVDMTGSELAVPLTEYQKLSKQVSLPKVSLKDGEVVFLTSYQLNYVPKIWKGFSVKEHIRDRRMPYGSFYIIKDSDYQSYEEGSILSIIAPDSKEMRKAAHRLNRNIQTDSMISGSTYFSIPLLQYIIGKAIDGVMTLTSSLIGLVFFTFSASFLYFRVYADINQQKKYYHFIRKLGLKESELNKVVTTQLAFVFFLPFLVGTIHSIFAFIALAKIATLSIIWNTVLIISTFFILQILYFFFIRWCYMKRLKYE